MRRWLKAFAVFVVFPIAVGAVLVLVLADTQWGNERARRLLVSQLNGRITGTFSAGSLRGNLFHSASLGDVRLVDSLRAPVFAARRVSLSYSILDALRGRVVISSLTLDTAEVDLDQKPGQRWNFQGLMKPSPSGSKSSGANAPPVLRNIAINHSRFYYRRAWSPDSTLSPGARDSSIAKALSPSARRRTERVAGGFQRVLDYHDITAFLSDVSIGKAGAPTAVQIARLAMLAEPYRPPVLDVRSLEGTLYASKDSLWWRNAHMVMPASDVRGDGTIGFHRSGFRLDLRGAPIALADLAWLDPQLPRDAGGTLRYVMNLHGDTADFAVHDADMRYQGATLTGDAAVALVTGARKKTSTLLRAADLTVNNLSTTTIQSLTPSIRFRRQGVLGAHVVASGSVTDLAVNANVAFADPHAGTSGIVVRGHVAGGTDFSARDLVIQFQPVQVATIRAYAAGLKIGGVLTGDVVLNGSKSAGITARMSLTQADGRLRNHVAGNARYAFTSGRFVTDVDLDPFALATLRPFAPSAELTGEITGHAAAQGSVRNVQFSASLRSSRGGTADVGGSVNRTTRTTAYDLNVLARALDLRAFSAKAPVTLLNGRIIADGRGTSLATANARFSVDLATSRYDTFTVDRLLARGAAAKGMLRVDTMVADAQGARAFAKGTLGLVSDKVGELSFSASVDSLSAFRKLIGSTDTTRVRIAGARTAALLHAARVDSLRRADSVRIERLALGLPEGVELRVDTLIGVPRDSISGSARVTGSVFGNIRKPEVNADLTALNIAARGYSAQHLSASVRMHQDRITIPVPTFSIHADSIEAFGRSIASINALGGWSDHRVDLNSLQIHEMPSFDYFARGTYRWSDSAKTFALDSLAAHLDSVRWYSASRAQVRIAANEVTVSSLDLRATDGGTLVVSGRIPEGNGVLTANLSLQHVHVAPWLRAAQLSAFPVVTASLSAKVSGTRADPVFDGRAEVRDAYYSSDRLPDVDVDFHHAAQRMLANATFRDSTGSQLVSARASLPLDLALASVPGSRKLDGPLSASIVLQQLSLGSLPFRTTALDEFHGQLAGNAAASGSWAHTDFSGHITLRDGGFIMPLSSTGMHLENALADVHFSRDSVVLDSLVGFARGSVRAHGFVDISDRSKPVVSFAASATDLRVFDSPRGLVDADATVVASGPLDEIRVSGNGQMKGGFLALKQFRKDLLRVKAPGELSFFAVYDTAVSPSEALRRRIELTRKRTFAVIADLSMVVDRGNYYRNRPDANTEFYTGDGEVVRAHLDQRSGDEWIVGFTRIGDGITVFRTRAFVPARGALTFGAYTNAPGIVQQVGELNVWEPGRGLFAVQLLTGGTSVGPALGLESGTLFPMRGRELNGYLTMGRLNLALLQQSGSSLSGSEAWSGQLSGETGALAHRQQAATALGVVLHDIATGAAKEFALDALSVSPGDVPTELVFGKTGGVRGALVEGGRYVTPDLYVAGQLRLTRGIPGLRIAQKFGPFLRLDVGIEPRFTFRNPAELGITHPTERTGAFGAFLTRMWDF